MDARAADRLRHRAPLWRQVTSCAVRAHFVAELMVGGRAEGCQAPPRLWGGNPGPEEAGRHRFADDFPSGGVSGFSCFSTTSTLLFSVLLAHRSVLQQRQFFEQGHKDPPVAASRSGSYATTRVPLRG